MKFVSLAASLAAFAVTQAKDQPEEFFFETNIDHFAAGGHSDKFQIRYLVNDEHWDPETGPILFYSGNEGDIYSFYDNAGFMTETVAEETKGLIVFGEHRYFGVSYPFEPEVAFTPENNVYLRVEQAMMDFVELIKFVREDYDAQDKACIVFGGSYGGMLAGWLRMKHPQTFQGALAMSAPILYFQDAPSAPEEAFGDICTDDFRASLDKSPELIRESFEAMIDMKERQDTWSQLDSIFNTCTAIQSEQDIEYLYEHLSNGYLYMAMTDYPYPANFLEPMPAWPVAESIKPFIDIPTLSEV